MKKFFQRLRPYRFPVIVLAISILSFGLLIAWLGFYWDDWPLAWFSHQFGPQFFIGYAPYRAASGWLYFFSFSILGESPFAWQLYALAWRFVCVLTFWWLVRLLWPKSNPLPEVAALIFALYPGFSQQPIAVTYSLYWMYYTFFLASLCLMVLSLRGSKHKLYFLVPALLLSTLTMLSTEYFYGVELARGVLIWIYLGRQEKPARRLAVPALKEWAPYLLLAFVVFVWRYSLVSQPGSLYTTPLIGKLFAQPPTAIAALIATILGDYWEAVFAAWARVAPIWDQLVFGSIATWVYFGVVGSVTILSLLALWPRAERAEGRWRRETLMIGGATLALGGLSFWLAELPLRLAFAWDRFTLPMMVGTSLLLATAVEILRERFRATVIFVCLVLGLSAGYHFLNANNYREEWEAQENFFKQLVWRAPSIIPNTALISMENSLEHYTDNSLTAPLIWIYNQEATSDSIPYYIGYLDLRTDEEFLGGGSGTIRKTYRHGYFVGRSEDVLFFYYSPPACLRILDPELDRFLPGLPKSLTEQAQRSNLTRITRQADQDTLADFPFWSFASNESWCYYFETADLARQFGDWEQVAALGDLALALDDAPNHPAERTPFIEGYAHTGNWDRAIELSRKAMEINPMMQAMLCTLWQRIADNTPASEDRGTALLQIEDRWACGIN
ncbi:MAG: hypothetical protein M1347_00200 [Chloroflexi bacterium]|nr:hypothetical protein [Chloroflexota bacterium]